ncbi:MAG: FeoA domain-containing protein [Oxalobacter formigenes]|nr:FeoA domain-containing protein [Oxalobacter formigenes]
MPDTILVLTIVAAAASYIVYRYAFRKSGACSCATRPGSVAACAGCCHNAGQKTVLVPSPQQQHTCCQEKAGGKGEICRCATSGKHNMRTINLRQMQIGETATVTAITAQGELGRRIRDMGLTPGATVEIIGRAPLKDPVALQLEGFTLTLRNNEADWITVTLPSEKKLPPA